MNPFVADFPEEGEIHVILDNLTTHKTEHDRWLKSHPNVHFHFTPTQAGCYVARPLSARGGLKRNTGRLNRVEVWSRIMARVVLKGTSFAHPR